MTDAILYLLMAAWLVIFVAAFVMGVRDKAKLHDEDDYR